MSFSAKWLALRESYDHAARNAEVAAAAVAAFAHLPRVNIVDLACGTGSTLRALGPRIKTLQSWLLVDNDIGLLARTPRPDQPAIAVATMPLDLNRDLEAALDGGCDLVTASALLDLVSAQWLERLATELAARRLPFYAALSYAGIVKFAPPDQRDQAVIEAFNAHQRTDKGFGPALGPTAANAAIQHFERLGYAVVCGRSDWAFAAEDRDIQRQTLSSVAAAARAVENKAFSADDLADWLAWRSALVESGRSLLQVGHVDFFARPIGNR